VVDVRWAAASRPCISSTAPASTGVARRIAQRGAAALIARDRSGTALGRVTAEGEDGDEVAVVLAHLTGVHPHDFEDDG
jgi:hypothetical protein